MREFFIGFWTDEAKFRAAMRSLLFFGGQLVQLGVIPTGTGGWTATMIGPLLSAGALMVPAGQQNKPTP